MEVEAVVKGDVARVFGREIERHEKGSAMELIRAEKRASDEKSLRLKALRLAMEAEAQPAPVAAPAKRKTAKRAAKQ
ncbi:hypothetical protein [Aureimonas psammosilenae]|uniref:hypothetical protein n=1 Tax=Aureimonas psammosilenae TaxID=2495496 RepID=UPI001260DDA3|nr:hypothetical protein [Aureimonas psammosilenae]